MNDFVNGILGVFIKQEVYDYEFVNGVANEAEVYEFTYAESVPLKVVDMAVERNEAGAIVLISFEFNQAVSANEEFELGGCIFMNYMAAYGSS